MWLVCFCGNAAVLGSPSRLPALGCASPDCISHGDAVCACLPELREMLWAQAGGRGDGCSEKSHFP